MMVVEISTGYFRSVARFMQDTKHTAVGTRFV